MQIDAEKNYCLASMSRFILVTETFQNTQFQNGLLSYGEHNHPLISVICLLKTSHLSAFIHLCFFPHVE